MRKLISVLALFSVLCSTSVFALDIHQAKQQGLIGEKPDGYVGVVQNRADAKRLVQSINAKRKARYQKMANKNNISLQQVQSLAAEKAYKKTRPGHYLWKNGRWAKK